MLKLLDIDQSYFHDEPVVRLLSQFDPRSKGFEKSASADDRITEYAKNIQPDSNKIYVHILAMGAGEYFGANRNADYFPEANLIQCFKTFETSPAHIFKHHQNKDPSIALGQVVFAIYNERMHRVEVVAWIDKTKGWDVVSRIEKGEFPATSMACHTPFDTCAICGNQARSRGEYCPHLRDNLGKVFPDGRKVQAINDGPLRFFDMSIVFRPADITSAVLQKLANEQGIPIMGSAEQAEDAQLQEKQANLKKLSELIKEVEGTMDVSAPSIQALLAKVNDPDDEILDFLAHYDIYQTIHALAELGISPSVSFFAKLIGQKMSGETAPGIEHLVCGMMKEAAEDITVDTDLSLLAKSASALPRAQITSVLSRFTKQASLYPEMALQRAFDPAEYPAQGPTGMIGYAGQGPQILPDPAESYRNLKNSESQETRGFLTTLAKIAGAAIAAKYLLSKLIEAKMQEALSQQQQKQAPGIKIVLVKSAQEAITTQKLVKADLLRNLKI